LDSGIVDAYYAARNNRKPFCFSTEPPANRGIGLASRHQLDDANDWAPQTMEKERNDETFQS
jgi:hypothetical protein